MQGELVFRVTVRKRKECGIIGSKVGWRSTFRVYLPVASRPAEDTSLEGHYSATVIPSDRKERSD